MNLNALAKNYYLLSAEERFTLILNARARCDDADAERLVASAPKLTLTVPHHYPLSEAFSEIASFVFLDLLDKSAQYLECFALSDVPDEPEERRDATERQARSDDAKGECVGEREAEDAQSDNVGKGVDVGKASEDDDVTERPLSIKYFDMALAWGYMLKSRADGWKRFCVERHFPPFALWGINPGWKRLQAALDMAEKVAFVEEGYVAFLNRRRPEGVPALTNAPLSGERTAMELEAYFRERVRWWSGETE